MSPGWLQVAAEPFEAAVGGFTEMVLGGCRSFLLPVTTVYMKTK